MAGDIEKLIGGISKNEDTYNHLFIAAQYQNKQNKQWYKEYLSPKETDPGKKLDLALH